MPSRHRFYGQIKASDIVGLTAGGGGPSGAGASPAYGVLFNPETGRLTMEVVEPDSGEVFESYKYLDVFLGLGAATFRWSADKPTHLLLEA